MGERFQFVWWWALRDWERPAFTRHGGSLARIYRWSFSVGPLEIRRCASTPTREG